MCLTRGKNKKYSDFRYIFKMAHASMNTWISSLAQLPWIPYYTQVPVATTTAPEVSFALYWAFALTIAFTLFVYIVEIGRAHV